MLRLGFWGRFEESLLPNLQLNKAIDVNQNLAKHFDPRSRRLAALQQASGN
jgi:hypothetical protein